MNRNPPAAYYDSDQSLLETALDNGVFALELAARLGEYYQQIMNPDLRYPPVNAEPGLGWEVHYGGITALRAACRLILAATNSQAAGRAEIPAAEETAALAGGVDQTTHPALE